MTRTQNEIYPTEVPKTFRHPQVLPNLTSLTLTRPLQPYVFPNPANLTPLTLIKTPPKLTTVFICTNLPINITLRSMWPLRNKNSNSLRNSRQLWGLNKRIRDRMRGLVADFWPLISHHSSNLWVLCLLIWGWLHKQLPSKKTQKGVCYHMVPNRSQLQPIRKFRMAPQAKTARINIKVPLFVLSATFAAVTQIRTQVLCLSSSP